jgi:hypothetical protein
MSSFLTAETCLYSQWHLWNIILDSIQTEMSLSYIFKTEMLFLRLICITMSLARDCLAHTWRGFCIAEMLKAIIFWFPIHLSRLADISLGIIVAFGENIARDWTRLLRHSRHDVTLPQTFSNFTTWRPWLLCTRPVNINDRFLPRITATRCSNMFFSDVSYS